MSGETRIPYCAKALLTGDLEPLGWKGWRVENDALIAPNGTVITKADLEAARRMGFGREPPTLTISPHADGSDR